MSDAPERIWTSTQTPLAQSKSGTWNEYPYGTCYIRKDLHADAIAERDTLRAEVERLREELNKIAEYQPMFDYCGSDEYGHILLDVPGSPFDRGRDQEAKHLSGIARAALGGGT